MPIVMMPDGTQVQMPDNPDPELIGRLKNYLANIINRPSIQAGKWSRCRADSSSPGRWGARCGGCRCKLGYGDARYRYCCWGYFRRCCWRVWSRELQQKSLEEFPKAAKCLNKTQNSKKRNRKLILLLKSRGISSELAFF